MKPTIKKITVIFLLTLSLAPLFSQVLAKREFNKAFEDANIAFAYEENYEKAARQYESLLNIYPENSNLIAKLGICYLNLDGRKTDALKLLTKAFTNVVSTEKEYLEYGEKAPLDTYLYLAIAYHRNDSLQKAVSLYTAAKQRLEGTTTYQEEYIDNQIRDCRYALEMKKKPLTIIDDLFASWLTDYPGACNPVLSKNDSVFIFTHKADGKTRILCSYKSGTWERPVDITPQLGGYDRFYSNSITGDGRLLIIYMDDGGDGNLYYSQRNGLTWSRIKSMGKPINTIYWESHGFITPDGMTIYIASNRQGGEGELDIWVSERDLNGSWKQPINCGIVINTPYDENYPYYDPSNYALIFSSIGHISMGGYDVFRSVNRNGAWTTPVGMPFAFNNTSDNTFFILNNNAPGFITSIYNENNNTRNIYAIVAEDPADKITLVQVSVSLQDGLSIDPKLISIRLSDLKAGAQLKSIPMTDASTFKFEIKPGDYQLFISQKGYKTDTINMNVPLYYLGNYISVNSSLIPDKVFGGDFLSIQNILFDFDSYKLNNLAVSTLEILRTILINYPELEIEVAGYTDAIGSTEYNRKLADQRAQAVIDYLSGLGISPSRLVKKAYGESNFIAVNTYQDGSDNPEGRKYNRRATFGIVDPQTGVVIEKETYTPEHLRQPSSMKYSIILIKTKDKLYPSYFSGLIMNDMQFVKEIRTDAESFYVLGLFYNRTDAVKYLSYAMEKGFGEAYIINQYDLNNETKGSLDADAAEAADNEATDLVYTVQVKATLNQLNISRVFVGLEGIKEIKASDGFYKYFYGEYNTPEKAKEALLFIKESGYEDAFIRQISGSKSQ